MDKKPTQSPTPWKVEKHSDDDIRIVGKNVTIAENFTEADAAYIVRAVNAHEELLIIAKCYQAICKGDQLAHVKEVIRRSEGN